MFHRLLYTIIIYYLCPVMGLRGGQNHGNRSLTVDESIRYILAVRVTDSEGRVNPATPNMISNKLFSTTNGDTLTFQKLIEGCSFGQFKVSTDYPVDISQHLSAEGVIDVNIGISLEGNDKFEVTEAAQLAVEETIGYQLSAFKGGIFHHVLMIFEGCYTDCGYSAFSFSNGFISGYIDDYWSYPSVVVHEIGHNLNLHHSGGMDGGQYSDSTCLMGQYSKGDQAICFNPAKSFQLARGGSNWYENNSDTIVWNSGTRGGTSWSGSITGIADYQNNPNQRPVVVKLESGKADDLFVGFNRAIGINRDVSEARNQVTVVQAGGDGLTFSQSYMKAILSEGESYVVSNWRGTGLDMTIHVKEINLLASPAYADLSMSLELGTAVPTYSPTLSAGYTLDTTYEYDSGSNGNMFTVKALNDIVITSFDINTMFRIVGEVKVYTRSGEYSGYESDGEGWNLIYDNASLQMKGRGKPTEFDGVMPVNISRGQYQSFYVWSEEKLVYKRGTQEGAPYVSDDNMIIYEGIGLPGFFGVRRFSPRVWSGTIHYTVSELELI